MKAIAIVGIGCRFPRASGPRAYWKLIIDKGDAISLLPRDRLEKSLLLAALPDDAVSHFYGGFLDNVEGFDANFFHISPREAPYIDPQQRLLLKVAWEALEDAGIVPGSLKGSKTGVFVGVSTNDYVIRSQVNPRLVSAYTGTGNALSINANRISYQFDLHGPSIAIDTACSSSLVAVHLACESLAKGECHTALAGGVNVILSPTGRQLFMLANSMAFDGRCKPFDSRADGFVRSEGAGIVILKPLQDAIADNNRIYGVIRGSAINQDGRTNGIMAPNRWAQEEVIREALEDAKTDPASIQYVEAHGTGTLLGDPIEATAISQILSSYRKAKSPLRIGSVKSNIGHLEAAAGVAGLIKVALSLSKETIPATINYQKPNPYIPFEQFKLKVQTEATGWPSGKHIAGISSFGFGGTNAHVVVEEAPPTSKKKRKNRPLGPYVFPVSAKSVFALKQYAQEYSEYIDKLPKGASLYDLCKTVACHRSHFESRVAFVVRSLNDLKKLLDAFARQQARVPLGAASSPTRGPVFVFSGQGSQWAGMGVDLLKKDSAFREKMLECDRYILKQAGWSIIGELTKNNPTFQRDISKIQPILFSISVSLAALWKSKGIEPAAVVGHSMGEIAAAYVAGILELKDAVRIVCRRSRLMSAIKATGAMAVIEFSSQNAKELIRPYKGKLSIAATNSPRSTVLSGEKVALTKLVKKLSQEGFFAKLVKVDVASHSSQVDPIRPKILKSLKNLRPRRSRIPFYSTVRATVLEGSELMASYWVDNLREPVLFDETITKLIRQGHREFVEVSPHPILLPSILEIAEEAGGEDSDGKTKSILTCPTLRRNENTHETILRSAASLHTAGQEVRWDSIYPDKGNLLSVPGYPWEERKFWLDDSKSTYLSKRASADFNGGEIDTADSKNCRIWQASIEDPPFKALRQKKFGREGTVPLSAYIELALKTARETFGDRKFSLKKLSVQKFLRLDEEDERKMQITLSSISSLGADFKAHSAIIKHKEHWKDTIWSQCGSARIELSKEITSLEGHSLEDVKHQMTSEINKKDFYGQLSQKGYSFNKELHQIERAWQGPNGILAEIQNPAEISEFFAFEVCFQPFLAFHYSRPPKAQAQAQAQANLTPASIMEANIVGPSSKFKWIYSRSLSEDCCTDIFIFNDRMEPIAEFKGVKYKEIDDANRTEWSRRKADWFYDIRWEVIKEDQLPTKNEKRPDNWVIVPDNGGVAKELCQYFTEKNTPFRVIEDDFNQGGNLIENLLNLRSEGKKVGIILLSHLDYRGPEYVPSYLSANQGLVKLLREWEAQKITSSFEILVVTAGAQSVIREPEPLNIFQTSAWGICRRMVDKYPTCFRIIDLPNNFSPQNIIPFLVDELDRSTSEGQIAYRDGIRYVPRLVRKEPKKERPIPFGIKLDRTYVIAGLENLGKLTARWLIDRGARRLIILGEIALPPRSEWRGRAKGMPERKTIEFIQQLERLGCQIDYRKVKVSDFQELERLFLEYREMDFPPIAGIVFDGSLKSQTIEGLWNLDRASNSLATLDFFVAYSSFSTWFDPSGLSGNVEFHSIMDAIVRNRRIAGKHGLVVNWAIFFEGSQTLKGEFGIPDTSTMEILEEFLSEDQTQIGVAIFNWQIFKQSYPNLAISPFLSRILSEVNFESSHSNIEGGPQLNRGVLSSITDKRLLSKVIQDYLVKVIAKAVRRMPSEIQTSQALNTLGLDSLMALEIKNNISKNIGAVVPVATFLKGVTVSELVTQILEYLGTSQISKSAPSLTDPSIKISQLSHADLMKIFQILVEDDGELDRSAA